MKETELRRPQRARPRRIAVAAVLCAWASGSALAQVPQKPASARAPASTPSSAPVPASASAPAPAPAPASSSAAPAPSESSSLGDVLTGSAKAAYDLARVLYRSGDSAGALLQFDRAYDLSSEPRLLWNIAVCEKNLRRYARATKALERYETEGGTRLSEGDKSDTAFLLKAMRPFVATLTIAANEPGAAVFIDDERAGTTPIASPLLIDMGARRIRVTKKGFHDFTKTEQVFGETELTLEVALKREVHQGRLIIVTDKDNVIRLDGKVVGQGTFDATTSSGGHTLRVTATGMKPYQSEVIVQENTTRRIPVTLDPEPKTGLPTWALVTGSVLLAAGAGVGVGYVAWKATEAPDPIQGTLTPYVIKLP